MRMNACWSIKKMVRAKTRVPSQPGCLHAVTCVQLHLRPPQLPTHPTHQLKPAPSPPHTSPSNQLRATTVCTMHLRSAIQAMSLQEQAFAARRAEEAGIARRNFASRRRFVARRTRRRFVSCDCQCYVADRRCLWVVADLDFALQK